MIIVGVDVGTQVSGWRVSVCISYQSSELTLYMCGAVLFTKRGNPTPGLVGHAKLEVPDAGGTRDRRLNPGAPHMAVLPLSFAHDNFGNLYLGDKRRTDRLVYSVEEICRHPGGTLPDKLKQPCDLHAFYHLMNRPELTHAVLLQAHAERTKRLISACAGVVLLIHDATELDYTSKTSLREVLGQIGRGSQRGYICHNSLAVRADTGETLGLAAQILHRRANVPKGETKKQSRERLDRESRLWLQGVTQIGPAPTGTLCVDVSDSLSDTFEYLYYEVTHGRTFLLRARENRRLQEPLAGQKYLFDALQQQPSLGQREVHVGEAPSKRGKKGRPARKGRKSEVEISYAPVTIAPPGKKLGEYQRVPLSLWAVRVWEKKAPAGEKPLEWVLLTNRPITSVKAAEELIDWYEKRWVIEEYHKAMKTGLDLEALQFTTREALEPTIAVLSCVATTLLRLRDAGRAADATTRPATDVVDPIYVETLHAYYGATLLSAQPSVREFYVRVARLGGHQNRKGDGMPGWLTLWRGWMKLQEMVNGYVHGKTSPTCRKT